MDANQKPKKNLSKVVISGIKEMQCLINVCHSNFTAFAYKV